MRLLPNSLLLRDFLTFSEYHLASRDVDPLYDVLKAMHSKMGLSRERAVQHVLWYEAWYNLMSAQEAWTRGRMTYEEAKLPTGTERRGFRDGHAMIRHWDDMTQKVLNHGGSWTAFVTKGWGDDPKANWRLTTEHLMSVWGNGRWAAYKGCELLQKVVGMSLTPPDMGHRTSSGPRKGLALLFPEAPTDDSAASIELLDAVGNDLLEVMQIEGLRVADLGEVETCCCDFHSLYQGHYYVGHDIDSLQEAVIRSNAPQAIKDEIFTARKASLPHHYLGELGGWNGVVKAFKTKYRDEKQIIYREPQAANK